MFDLSQKITISYDEEFFVAAKKLKEYLKLFYKTDACLDNKGNISILKKNISIFYAFPETAFHGKRIFLQNRISVPHSNTPHLHPRPPQKKRSRAIKARPLGSFFTDYLVMPCS
jgi:hypothetical protein